MSNFFGRPYHACSRPPGLLLFFLAPIYSNLPRVDCRADPRQKYTRGWVLSHKTLNASLPGWKNAKFVLDFRPQSPFCRCHFRNGAMFRKCKRHVWSADNRPITFPNSVWYSLVHSNNSVANILHDTYPPTQPIKATYTNKFESTRKF